MGLSKKDISRKKSNLKTKLAELELLAKKDPLKRNRALHDEIAMLKKKLESE